MEKIRNFLNKISPGNKIALMSAVVLNPTASGENTEMASVQAVMNDLNKNTIEVVSETTTQSDTTKSSIEWIANNIETKDSLNIELIQEILDNPSAWESSGYGERDHPVYERKIFHNGRDIATPIGTPTKTATDAVVLEVAYSDTMGGNELILLSADGRKITYEHLDTIQVAVGDTIPAGSVVALSGNSGTGTGAHLHIKVEVKNADGKYVSEDPKIFLNEIHEAKVKAARTEEWKETAVNVTRDRMQLP